MGVRACIPVRLYLPVHVCLHAPALLLFVCMCVSARVCVSFHSFPLLSPVRWVLADLSSHADVGWGEDVKINTHTCADEFLFKNREGGEADTMHRRSSIPPPTTLPHLCPPSIAAPSLTAKRHRDATEAERSSQTGPPPCCKPHWGSPLCLSLPSYHLHPLAALQPPRLSTSAAHHSRRQQQQQKKNLHYVSCCF